MPYWPSSMGGFGVTMTKASRDLMWFCRYQNAMWVEQRMSRKRNLSRRSLSMQWGLLRWWLCQLPRWVTHPIDGWLSLETGRFYDHDANFIVTDSTTGFRWHRWWQSWHYHNAQLNLAWLWLGYVMWGICCQKQVSQAGISNYIPQ